MKKGNLVSRRTVFCSAAAIGGLVFSRSLRAALPLTPSQNLGPFYPVLKPLDQDADLTSIAGKSGRAGGQIIHLMGKVLDKQGRPVPGARIEIWQANSHGRYTHPADGNPAPLDPNFEGFAIQVTDEEGRYRFKTIKPGAYPVTKSWTRPPHIHFDVAGRTGRVVTQMYFQDEPLNETDKLLQGVGNKQVLIGAYQPPSGEMEPDSRIVSWDITLPEAGV